MGLHLTVVQRLVAFAIVSAWVAGCASSSVPYSADYPMTEQTFRSWDGLLRGRIPAGWFTSSDDTIPPATMAWIARDDFAATITVREIVLDRTSAKRVDDDGCELLARLSVALRPAPNQNPAQLETQQFELGTKSFCGYEVLEDGLRKRVVVFQANGRYFESEAAVLKGVWSDDETVLLFTVQQTFLSSLEF